MARAMKNTGVDWIGEIPEDWETYKVKYLYSTNKAKLPKVFTSDTTCVPYLSMDYIRDNTISPQYAIEGDFCSNKDLLLLWDGSNAGEIIFEHPEGFAPSTTAILRKLNDKTIDIFDKYYLKALEIELRKNTNGMGIPHVDGDFFRNSAFLVPPIFEQQKIADYLDKKCSEIDSVLTKTRESIEEYKKLKQSIITQAVTKGIRPNRKMKDSGIEWIGEIPEDWETNYLSQIFEQVKNKNNGIIEKNLMSLSYGKIIRKNIDTTFGLLPENFEGYNIIEKDDIVLRLTDLQNDHKSLRVGLSKEKGIITSAYLTIRIKNEAFANYYYYLLHTFDIEKGFYGMGAGVRQGLNWSEVRNLMLITPNSVEEQKEICSYLDKKCSEIDTLVSKKEQLITELETYKKSLIYEYVTGKKEVK